MKQYETIAILRSDTPDKTVATLSKKVEKAVSTKPGELLKKDDWGLKKLCYEIQKQKQGRYLSWGYKHDSKIPQEVDRCLRFDETVLRYATFVIEKPTPRQEQLASAKPRRGKKSEGETFEETPKQHVSVPVDFRNPISLAKYITDKGKIVPRRMTGVDATTQKFIEREIKRARQMALLSYTEGLGFASRPMPEEERGE